MPELELRDEPERLRPELEDPERLRPEPLRDPDDLLPEDLLAEDLLPELRLLELPPLPALEDRAPLERLVPDERRRCRCGSPPFWPRSCLRLD